jgi:hypothetical protein
MELSKAVAGTALLLVVVLALGHASTQINSQESAVKPPEKSAPPDAGQKQPDPAPRTRTRTVA